MKNKILKVGSVAIAVAGFALLAFPAGAAPDTIIPIATSTLLADLSGYVPVLFNDLLPIIALVVGVIFAFWVINKAMGLATRRFRGGGRRGE